jgi:chromosome segregation ATPase
MAVSRVEGFTAPSQSTDWIATSAVASAATTRHSKSRDDNPFSSLSPRVAKGQPGPRRNHFAHPAGLTISFTSAGCTAESGASFAHRMSPTTSPDDLLVQLHARVAELEATIDGKNAEVAHRDDEVNRAQARLLLAQAQILELGDLLAAAETALKNAQAGTPNLQRILDAQLARTNELNQQLRTHEDQLAAGRLELAAAAERAGHADRIARESIAAVRQSEDSAKTTLKEVQADLADRRRASVELEAALADARQKLAAAESAAASNLKRAETAEAASAAVSARLQRVESHWLMRIIGPKHD